MGGMDMSHVKLNLDTKLSQKPGQRRPLQGAKFLVSYVFPHKTQNTHYACVFMMPARVLYYFEAKFMKLYVQKYADTVLIPDGQSVPLWMSSFKDHPLCKLGNAHEYKRSQKGYVYSSPFFILEMPNQLASLDTFLQQATNALASSFKEGTPCGSDFADYLFANKDVLYQIETGGNGVQKSMTHEEYGNHLQKHLVANFANKTIQHRVPLDKLMTYGHIKSFLVEHCGYGHWDQLPLNLKEAILSHKRASYPLWDETEIERY